MIEWLKELDTSAFFVINNCHHPIMDVVMMLISGVWIWIPLYAFLTYLVIKKFKKQSITIVIAIVIMIFLSDQGANLVKKNVQRYRPSHNIEIGQKVHTVDGYRGGQFGFVSSHASNVFALATLLCLLFSSYSRLIKGSFFIWASVICYSRIYLGVHYPLDILGGALLGVTIACIVFMILRKFHNIS